MAQAAVTINLTPNTTAQEAVDMAYAFAESLRKTGWPAKDGDYAKSLWIERDFVTSPLLPYLGAGFSAGYHGRMRPAAEQIQSRVRPVPPNRSRHRSERLPRS